MQNNDESTVKNESGPSNGENRLEDIMKSGSVISRSDGETIHCLTIIGQIEGHYLLGDGQKATKYEHILPLLVSIEESEEIDGMLMVLNTMGGDVEAGLAIAEMVSPASTSPPIVKPDLPSPRWLRVCRSRRSRLYSAADTRSVCRWRYRRKNPLLCRLRR